MEAVIGGAVVGVAVAVIAPSLVTGLFGVLRPIAKEVIKGGIVAYDAVTGMVSEGSESLKDLVAEARNDLEAAKSPSGNIIVPATH
jgi:hypothetical protein